MATVLLLSLALAQAAWVHLYREGVHPYVAKVTIGVETFSLQISTTSSLSLVTSMECSNCFGPSGFRKAYSTNQDTFHSLSPTAEECFSKSVTVTKECGFSYNDNSNYTATGALSTETFKFGGVDLTETVFGRVFQEQNYGKKGIDGVLGFGPGDLLLTYGLSIEERVLKQQSLKDVFSLCHDDEEGLLYVGGINPKVNAKNLVSFPIESFSQYALPLLSVTAGYSDNLLNSRLKAVIDTTYRYIGLPEDVIMRMIVEFRRFYGDGCTLSTCSESRNILRGYPIARPTRGFPQITLMIGAVNMTLNDYIFPCESNSQLYCSMVVQSPSKHQAILGNVALSRLELVIDRENASILYPPHSIGEKQGDCKPPQDEINLWDQGIASSRVFTLLFTAAVSLILTLTSLW